MAVPFYRYALLTAPDLFVTTKLDVIKAQAGVQQVLTDETTGHWRQELSKTPAQQRFRPHGRAMPPSRMCTVSIDGTSATVTFQDNNHRGRQ